MNKIIFFDFDGVIVSSIELTLEINREIITDMEMDDLKDWVEGNVYSKKIKGIEVDETMTSLYFEKYGQRVVKMVPVEGMGEVLEKIKKKGWKMLIISSADESSIENFLDKNGLRDYFLDVMAKHTHASKVEKFKMALKKYKIEPKDALMVTDTVGDVKEAHEVKIKAIGVTWGLHEEERLLKNGVDFVARKPEDIWKGIKEILA